MLTPNFNDIGKKIKDLFDKNFPAGYIKMSASFPKVNDISLNISGSQNIDSGKLVSSLDTKFNFNLVNKNFVLTEKWTVSNEIQSLLEVQILENVKSNFQINLEPSTGKKTLKLKNNYLTEMINAFGEIEFRQTEPLLTLGSMFRIVRSIPFYGGGLISFDTLKQKFTKIGYGVEYNSDNTCISGKLSDNNDLLFQFYKKFEKSLEVGFEAGFKIESKNPNFAIATKYDLNDGSSFKAKFDLIGNLSFGYTFYAREGIKLTFGTKLDCKNINGGGHKLGLQFEV